MLHLYRLQTAAPNGGFLVAAARARLLLALAAALLQLRATPGHLDDLGHVIMYMIDMRNGSLMIREIYLVNGQYIMVHNWDGGNGMILMDHSLIPYV